jgi:hypothetical protein
MACMGEPAPLPVHAVLFGGGYRAEAEAVARRFA